MTITKPAVGLVATPGRVQHTLELAKEIEDRDFAGLYCPSLGDALALCQSIAHVTTRIPFATSVQPIYHRPVADFASTTAYLHALAPGRLRFGIGVAHEPLLAARGLQAGKPLADIAQFVAHYRATPRVGALPPVILASLRPRMIALAGRIADGLVSANAARSHLQASLAPPCGCARKCRAGSRPASKPQCSSPAPSAAAGFRLSRRRSRSSSRPLGACSGLLNVAGTLNFSGATPVQGRRSARGRVCCRFSWGRPGFDVGRETEGACRGAEHLVNPTANHIVANDDNYALAA